MKMTSRKEALALPVACFCLFFSGMGSLVLEVVWSRALQLVFGSTTLAVSTVLVSFMLGLGFGGLLGGRIASRLKHPIRAYALVELAVAAYAMLVPFIIDLYPLLNRVVLHPLPFWPSSLLRFLLVLVLLVIPTLLMGSTLPLLVAALVRSSDSMAARVGLLYGVNTLGAVVGTLGATFVFFPKLGLLAANFAGAGIDLFAGLTAFFLLSAVAGAPSPSRAAPGAPVSAPTSTSVRPRRWSWPLVSYGLVGLTGLAYEVCWTRSLTMVFGSSVYAFATMLAAFLTGIALGSLLARHWVDRIDRPLLAYAGGLVLLGLSSLATIPLMSLMPSLFLKLMLWLGISGKVLLAANVALSFATMIVPTLVLGALFPLLAKAVTGPDRGPSASVGDVYFVNTIGAAVGSFLAGFVLIPWLGVRQTIALAVATNMLVAATMLYRQLPHPPQAFASAGGVAILAVLLAVFPPEWNQQQLDEGVYQRPEMFMDYGLPEIPMPGVIEDELLFYEEGLNTTVSVHRTFDGLVMRINGKTDASEMDMNTQVLSGHLPLLFGEEARQTLVIGHASGITAGAVSLHRPDRLDIAEIESEIIAASRYFQDLNHRPLEREFTNLIVDDGRHFLDATNRRYDVIISEPSNPWITGCSNLFTREFFEIAHRRLEPGGRLLQWIQLYGMDDDGLRSVLSALSASFDHVYGFMHSAYSVDLLLMASDRPITPADLPRWDELTPNVQDDLRRVNVHSTGGLWSLLMLTPEDIRSLAEAAPVENTDDNMYVELRAPLLLYTAAEDNLRLLAQQGSGMEPLLRAELGDVEPREIGAMALSYLTDRAHPVLASRMAVLAEEAGDRAHPLLVQAAGHMRRGPAARAAARRAVQQSLEQGRDLFLPRLYAARVLGMSGRSRKALLAAEAALALRPDHLPARREWTKALARAGRTSEAYAEAMRLVDSPLRVADWDVLAEGASIATSAGQLEVAEDLLETYLERRPYSASHWSMLARLRAELGKADARRRAETNADLAEQNLIREGRRRAYQYANAGEVEDARTLLERMHRRYPDHAGIEEQLHDVEASITDQSAASSG